MSDSNFTTPEQRAARDAQLAQNEHAMKLAGEVASLAMDNKALRGALRDTLAALQKLSAVFDMDEHDQDRAHAEACAMREARAAIAKATGEEG